MRTPRVLITGAYGQIGTEFTSLLAKTFGMNNVFTSDITFPERPIVNDGLYTAAPKHTHCDITDYNQFEKVIKETKVTNLVHFASTGEKNPDLALKVNARGAENALSLANKYNLRVLLPSSVGVND